MITNMHQDVCTYSAYSLQFFLLLPLIKLGQQFELAIPLNYVMAMVTPIVLLDCLMRLLSSTNCLTLVKHIPGPDHPHSGSNTLGVIIRSLILGMICSLGYSFINSSLQPHFVPLGFYLVLLSSFHFSEYFVTSLTNPSTLNLSSFLLEQSIAYVIAISCSFVEYFIEAYLFPELKKFNLISLVGLLIAIAGEIIRKLAMITAGKNFTHLIACEKNPEHKLVTHGVYGHFRHPSYAGWFYWAVGTQLLMLNPICILLFAVLSYKFFKDRISFEEELLIEFFGNEYELYRKKVGLWMPIW